MPLSDVEKQDPDAGPDGRHAIPPEKETGRGSESCDGAAAYGERRADAGRVQSTLPSDPPAVLVARCDRRGLFARLAVIPELTQPYQYSRRAKWAITVVVAVCGAAAPMGSAIVMPALQPLARALHSSPTVGNLSVAAYMLAMSVFPLWWSSFSETAGRRTIYLVSFALFVLFTILSAVSNSMAMLVVMRTLSGGAAASVQAVGAGTIADIWEVRERGKAMGLFYLGPLCGPLLAPIVGGALTQAFGWRSTQWFLVIYGGITLLLVLFCLPETLKVRRNLAHEAERHALEQTASARQDLSRVSTRQSAQVKTRQYLSMLRRIFIDPLLILAWIRSPPVALVVYYASITFGSLYFLNISIQVMFSRAPYQFSTLIVGLLYIPASVGYILASILGGRWTDKIMHREAKKAGRYDKDTGRLIFRPEDRMRENAWFAAVLWPCALIWYGWTADKGVIWVVPVRGPHSFLWARPLTC